MNIGDLVLYKERRHLVRSYDKVTRTVVIVAQDGSTCELPAELDVHQPHSVSVLANPGKQWKVLTSKVKLGAGPFVKATVPQPLLRGDRVLEPWVDWIASDPFREGGSIFISPQVGLRLGDMVILTHRNGTTARVSVTSKFSTVTQLRRSKEPPKKVETNRFTSLLDDDED
jgi:hypothetical protein